MDMSYLVNQIKAPPSGLRLRQGKVTAVNTSPNSVDVVIAGDPNVLPSVKYLNSYTPIVNDIIFLISSGSDLLVLGDLA